MNISDLIVDIGGVGNNLIYTALGLSHGYIRLTADSCRWDICAGEAFLTSSGGIVCDIYGDKYEYSD